MPLANAPYGFRPHRHLTGGDSQRTRQYPIATGYATAIGEGDPVALISDGTITVAAAAARVLGVFRGVSYTAADGSQVYTNRWPASTAATNIKADVIDDPMVTFRVQSGGTPTSANVGELADHVTGTPSAFTGTSTAYLNSSSGTAAKQWRILRVVDEPGNSGIFASLEVQCFQHEMSTQVAGTPGV